MQFSSSKAREFVIANTACAWMLFSICAASSISVAAAQESYPDRPIKIVVPFPPGGVNDIIARPFAELMKMHLGTLVIENRAGAGGAIGALSVARSEPDGYTLLLGSGATHIVGPQMTGASYNPRRDFRSIAILTVSGLALAVHPSLHVDTLKALIDYVGAHPAALSYGSAGVGSATHLAGELFKSLIKAPGIAHVPYRGGAPALTDLVGGQIKMAWLNVSGQMIALHQAGKIRVLAVSSPQRASGAPEIPTAVEAGLPGMVAINFAGLFAPAGTSSGIIDRIAEAARKTMADKTLREMYNQSGFDLASEDNPTAAQHFVDEEIARWSPVIGSVNLKAD